MVARELREDSRNVAEIIYRRGEIVTSKWRVKVDKDVMMPLGEKLVVPSGVGEDVQVCMGLSAYSYRKDSVARGRGRIDCEGMRKGTRMAQNEFFSPSGRRHLVDLRKEGEAYALEDERAVDAKETLGVL